MYYIQHIFKRVNFLQWPHNFYLYQTFNKSTYSLFSFFFHTFNTNLTAKNVLSPTLIPLSGVGTTCFSSCCDKDSAIIFTTDGLPDVNPP
jgi:hypothetical protein